MTNLGTVLKSRDITLPTKVHIVKAVVFSVGKPGFAYIWIAQWKYCMNVRVVPWKRLRTKELMLSNCGASSSPTKHEDLVLALLEAVQVPTQTAVIHYRGQREGSLWAKGTAKLIKGQNRQLDCSNLNKLWLQWLAPPELLSLSQCSPQETRTCWEMGLWEGKHRLV